MEHTGCKSAVLGISGGLDSTLALLVTARAMDFMGLDRKNITAVTMPCFGTTDRTYTNACELTKRLGAELLEVDIKRLFCSISRILVTIIMYMMLPLKMHRQEREHR